MSASRIEPALPTRIAPAEAGRSPNGTPEPSAPADRVVAAGTSEPIRTARPSFLIVLLRALSAWGV
jgi:hypothetical protein